MKHRKYALAGLTVLMAVCFGLTTLAFGYSAQDPIVLKCGIDNPPQDMKARTIKKLGDLVEERTQGRIKFEYFYGGSLIKKPQFVDAVARGIADISTGPTGFVSGKIPELSIFEVFGSWPLDKFLEVEKAIAPGLTELFQPKGVHYLMIQYNGTTLFSHRTKFLKTPDDWKGQKIRLSGRWLSQLGAGWGASTVFMAPNELYLALQRGVIDGYQLIYDIIFGLKLYEVAPYIVECGFNDNIEVVTMNQKKWEALTPEDQKIFSDAVQEVLPWTYEETLKYYDEIRKNIVAAGGQIYKLTPEERAAFLKDAYAIWPEVREVSGPLGNQFCDILEKFREN